MAEGVRLEPRRQLPAGPLDQGQLLHADGCVEVQSAGSEVQVRDSKLGKNSPVLRFTPDEWTAFLAGVRSREFDVPVA